MQILTVVLLVWAMAASAAAACFCWAWRTVDLKLFPTEEAMHYWWQQYGDAVHSAKRAQREQEELHAVALTAAYWAGKRSLGLDRIEAEGHGPYRESPS